MVVVFFLGALDSPVTVESVVIVFLFLPLVSFFTGLDCSSLSSFSLLYSLREDFRCSAMGITFLASLPLRLSSTSTC